MSIHSSALVHPSVDIDASNDIGPGVIIEEGVVLGRRNRLLARAFLGTGTTLGDDNVIHMSAVVGHVPQDLAFQGEPSFTRLGNRNVIREFVTIHRGTSPGSATVLGDDCFLMANAHVAHNCQLGNRVILVNGALLAGHVTVGDRAFISGLCLLHQFVRVGTLAMLSGASGLSQDAPPYLTVSGRPGRVVGLNAVGLRRAGHGTATRAALHQAYRVIYRSGSPPRAAAESLLADPVPEVQELARFVIGSKRGVCGSGPED